MALHTAVQYSLVRHGCKGYCTPRIGAWGGQLRLLAGPSLLRLLHVVVHESYHAILVCLRVVQLSRADAKCQVGHKETLMSLNLHAMMSLGGNCS